ncbi:MAG TPA: hypothetical protein DCM54_05865 [Gammaproteobacteria bacterium]|nr:hypothetical protein [Gammaproteobacteria bacterium]|tara:strand:+ start:2584 stop:2958 length:375 start_codon:yes stop_codon:yes gene_type:complete
MTGLLLFCAYMTFIYMPFDLFYKPVAEDEEIWFGITLHGWAAKATEPLHWAIYGAVFYGFLKMKHWMHPWAALYVAQVAIAMFVFPIVNDPGNLGSGLIAGTVFMLLGIALFNAKDEWRPPPAS